MSNLNHIIMNIQECIENVRRQIYISSERRQQAIDVLLRLERQEQMTKEEAFAYAKKIRPLVRGTKKDATLKPNNLTGKLFWANAPYIASESFTSSENNAIRKARGLKEVGRITTYHQYDLSFAHLCPNIFEAITQCPKQWLDKVVAFEFQVDTYDYSHIYDELVDRNVLRTIYYTGTLPEDIANLPLKW